MAYRLSGRAHEDLLAIYAYSLEAFGDVQAERYQEELDACFGLLADNPGIGRAVTNPMKLNQRRHPHGSHMVFYEIEPGQPILILSVVHMNNLTQIREFDS